jgi:phosphonoacetaldehyde hydrolase
MSGSIEEFETSGKLAPMRNTHSVGIRLVVFDWTGTLIDHGSRAPLLAMMATFQRARIELTPIQARVGTELNQRDRIETILRIPEVLRRFRGAHGRSPDRDDIDQLLTAYAPEQLSALQHCSELIDGVTAAASFLRQREIAIATATDYSREAAALALDRAQQQGFVPDYAICADDLRAGTSAAFKIHACMRASEIYHAREVLVVGDTLLDNLACLEGGYARVGVAATGHEVGLPSSEWNDLPLPKRNALLANAHRSLRDAGAQFVLDTLHELPLVVEHIQARRLSSAA